MIDSYGNRWPDAPASEFCGTCGQPDNCGDCNHTPLPPDDVRELGGIPVGEFPLDKDGKPLAWPTPDLSGWYADAWNGIYDSRQFALSESRDWIADESERTLAYGEDIIDEEERERRLAAKEVSMTEPQLTEAGLRYAYAHRESIVARVALMGRESGWPESHVTAAIKVCNEQASQPPTTVIFDNGYDGSETFKFDNERQARLGRAYLETFTGPWGPKASEEDTLLSVLNVMKPGEWNIDRLRSDERMSAVADELHHAVSEGDGDLLALLRWLEPRIEEALA